MNKETVWMIISGIGYGSFGFFMGYQFGPIGLLGGIGILIILFDVNKQR